MGRDDTSEYGDDGEEDFRREIARLLSRCRCSLRARVEARLQYDLIYVRTHVVKAHFRRRRRNKKGKR